jgi:16S rRNA (adenine1518-N6/adenine1519-N6)-dimethyltransferase
VSRQKFGQHVLIKGSILERIARAACPEPELLVIEIGPGRGALTERLLTRAARIVAIEIDPYLVEHLRQKFCGQKHLTIIEADALATDLAQWGPAVVAGNLPYYAATPIMEAAVALGASLRRGVFLIQKEVAERITATPGSRDYGYLSVQMGLWAECRYLFDVKPSAFHPPPKVDSAVLLFEPHGRAEELGIRDPAAFLAFVSQCFRQKRKTIRNNLAAVLGKDVLENWPEASLRAEQLSLARFAEMYCRAYPEG